MQSVLSTSVPLAHRPKSLSDSLAGKIALSVAATGFVAICAHISLPLPFTAVPLTLQTFAVILIGMVLGAVEGFSSLALYLAERASGLPVFSPHGPGGVAQLLGPTAGYLFSYPLAAAAAGLFTRTIRISSSSFRNGLIGGTIPRLPIFALAAAWYTPWLHLTPPRAYHPATPPL